MDLGDRTGDTKKKKKARKVLARVASTGLAKLVPLVEAASEAELDRQDSELAARLARLGEQQAEAQRGLEKIVRERERRRRSESQREQMLCVVCMDAEKSVMMVPCNHLCVCAGCAQSLSRCPMCMSDVTGKTSVYL